MELTQRRQLAECCHALYQRGFMPGIDGNVSMRMDNGHILVTPSAVSKQHVTPESLVCMTLEGEALSEGKPSIEAQMHIEAYRHFPDAGAVIHAHSPCATAIAIAQKRIDTRCAPFAWYHLGSVGYVPYQTSGSAALHNAIGGAFAEGHRVLLMGNHGTITVGRDLSHAFELTDLLEAYADMLIKAQALGGAQPLSEKQLSELTGG